MEQERQRINGTTYALFGIIVTPLVLWLVMKGIGTFDEFAYADFDYASMQVISVSTVYAGLLLILYKTANLFSLYGLLSGLVFLIGLFIYYAFRLDVLNNEYMEPYFESEVFWMFPSIFIYFISFVVLLKSRKTINHRVLRHCR